MIIICVKKERVGQSGKCRLSKKRKKKKKERRRTIFNIMLRILRYYNNQQQTMVETFSLLLFQKYIRIYVYVYTYITCFFGASTCRLAHAPLRSDSLITLELTHLPNHRRRVSLVVQLASLFTYSSLLYIPLSRPARSLRVVSHSRTIRMLDSRSTDP